jgi:hypothetical protein
MIGLAIIADRSALLTTNAETFACDDQENVIIDAFDCRMEQNHGADGDGQAQLQFFRQQIELNL